MSKNSSPNQSSNGSAAELIKIVEQLIESDEEEKNLKKLSTLKNQFPVLKKMHSFMPNGEKLQLFLKDPLFRHKIQETMIEKGVYLEEGTPMLKIYLVSTRYGASVTENLDEADLLNVFQQFGPINELYVSNQFSFVSFQHLVSAYLCTKILNQFEVSEYLRLCVKWCGDQQAMEAQSLIISQKINQMALIEPAGGCMQNKNKKFNELKFIAKFELETDSLPEFNIAQRIIGPRGNNMKKIFQKVISQQPRGEKYTISNINSILKIRLRGKGSGFLENSQKESDQKMHLFISCKEKPIYECACQEIELLLIKVFQNYKVSYQKLYRQHAHGVAYRIMQFETTTFKQIRQVLMGDIENTTDLLSLENQGKLAQKIVEEKILEREKARKMGKFQEADQIRNWLRLRGVNLTDSKTSGRRTTWNYMKL